MNATPVAKYILSILITFVNITILMHKYLTMVLIQFHTHVFSHHISSIVLWSDKNNLKNSIFTYSFTNIILTSTWQIQELFELLSTKYKDTGRTSFLKSISLYPWTTNNTTDYFFYLCQLFLFPEKEMILMVLASVAIL